MNTFDLETAFYRRLIGYTADNLNTVRPYELFDPESIGRTVSWRRGSVVNNMAATIGWGHGAYSRTDGLYQIDIWTPREVPGSFQTLMNLSDAHVDHFFPINGRGLSLSENSTAAHITSRPVQKTLGREGAFLRAVISVDFYVEIPAS